jgi:hypothetical protein
MLLRVLDKLDGYCQSSGRVLRVVSLISTPVWSLHEDLIEKCAQVHQISMIHTKVTWKEDGLGMLTKGLSTRMVSFSGSVIVGMFLYESIKTWCLKDEYKI